MNIRINGLDVHYQKIGKGPVLLLLHGWATNLQNMHQIAEICSKKYTVISLDFPGFGASDQPSSVWGVDEYSDFIVCFLEHINIKKLHGVIGHSFGGRIAITLVADKKINIKRMVLIGSAGIKPKKDLRQVLFLLIAKVGKVVFSLPGLRKSSESARNKLYAQANSTDYIQAGSMKDIFIKTIKQDLSDCLVKITLPTLLIWGSEDSQTPLRDGRYFHTTIKHSTLKIIQGKTHFIHNEEPKKVSRWIMEFLA